MPPASTRCLCLTGTERLTDVCFWVGWLRFCLSVLTHSVRLWGHMLTSSLPGTTTQRTQNKKPWRWHNHRYAQIECLVRLRMFRVKTHNPISVRSDSSSLLLWQWPYLEHAVSNSKMAIHECLHPWNQASHRLSIPCPGPAILKILPLILPLFLSPVCKLAQ